MTPELLGDIMMGLPTTHLAIFDLVWEMTQGDGKMDYSKVSAKQVEVDEAHQQARAYAKDSGVLVSAVLRCTRYQD